MIKMRLTLLYVVLASLFPCHLYAQTISTGPLRGLPVNNPWMLLGLVLAFVACAFWLLRNNRHFRPIAFVLAAALISLSLWQIPELRAQLAASFSNPAGETLLIPVQQIAVDDDIAGFEQADFSNGSGVTLTIRSIVLPTFTQCFPGGLTTPLLPPGQPDPNPPATCAAGMVLPVGATCRVDVDTRCRTLADENLAVISVNPATLELTANGSAESVTVTNTSSAAAQNVTASIPGGSSLVISGTTCGATLAASASCTITFTPPTAAEGPTTVTVAGDNTNTVNVDVTVLPEPVPAPTLASINPSSGGIVGGTSFTLTGTNLTGTTGVTFGGVSATSVTVVNDTTVTGVTPAHAVGSVDVVISTPAGSTTLTNGYTYTAFCASSPCVNGGVCNEGFDSYTCNCPPDYYGQNCEIYIPPPDPFCTPNPCLNGAACINSMCMCPPPFYGLFCEFDGGGIP